MISFQESLLLSDGDVVDIRLRDTLRGDILYPESVNELDYRRMNWHQVVWMNEELAEMSRQIAEAEVNGTRTPEEIIFPEWIEMMAGEGGKKKFELLLDRLPSTEMRFVERFVDCMKPTLRSNADYASRPFMLYDHGRGIWIMEGSSSLSDGYNVQRAVSRMLIGVVEALRIAQIVMETLMQVVAPDPGPKPGVNVQAAARAAWQERDELRKWALAGVKKLERFRDGVENGKHTSLLREVRNSLIEPATLWDSEMRWLVVGDGVVDLEKVVELDENGEIKNTLDECLFPWGPQCWSTMSLDVKLLPALEHQDSEWLRGVKKVLPEDDVRDYLQMRFGAALLGTPGVVGKSMVWQFGEPDTAKSSIMECIAGQDGVFSQYSIVASGNALTVQGERTGEAERTKAYARGKRYLIMDELDAGAKLSQALLKTLTGGNSVVGTAKYANSVQYLFTATMFMASNDEPTYPPGDVAFRNRIHIVPFKHKLWVRSKDPEKWEAAGDEDRADESWKEKILADPSERGAILMWVLDGLVKFALTGGVLMIPAIMRETGEEFGSASDPILHTVRSLLGTDHAGIGEEPQVLRVWTDAEWEDMGFKDTDSLPLREFDKIFEIRLRELEYLRDSDAVPAKWKTQGRKTIENMGGSKKRVSFPSPRTTRWCFSRITYVPEARWMKQMAGAGGSE